MMGKQGGRGRSFVMHSGSSFGFCAWAEMSARFVDARAMSSGRRYFTFLAPACLCEQCSESDTQDLFSMSPNGHSYARTCMVLIH